MPKPVKVLHLSASDKGGAFVVAQNLVDNLHGDDFVSDHLIFTGINQNISITGIGVFDKLVKFFLHAYEKLILLFYEKDKNVRFKFSLGKPGIPYVLLKQKIQSYDIIHLHWINKGFVNISDLSKFNKPIVWTCHDIWPVTGGCHYTSGCTNYISGCGNCPMLAKPKEHDISKLLVYKKTAIYNNLDLTFVSPSGWMDKNITTSQLAGAHKHIVIPNGINTSVFNYKGNVDACDTFVIGFVAANLNDVNKALYRLIEAIKLLDGKINCKLMLIGNHKESFKFDIPCSYQIISDADSPDKMAAHYRQMNLLAVTSTIETYPTTLLEALCCGVSVIGFNVGGIREIITPFAGQLIEPFNIEKYAEGIRHLYENRMDRQVLAHHSQERLGNNIMVEGYKALYKQILCLN